MSQVFQPYDVVDFRGVPGTVLAVVNTSQVLVGFETDDVVARSWKPWPCVSNRTEVGLFGANCTQHVLFTECVGPQAKWPYAWWLDQSDLVLRRHGQVVAQVSDGGMRCKKCNGHFPFAEPNQPDGTLVCWNCRNYPHYKGRL